MKKLFYIALSIFALHLPKKGSDFSNTDLHVLPNLFIVSILFTHVNISSFNIKNIELPE
jgi:hypothetical protein